MGKCGLLDITIGVGGGQSGPTKVRKEHIPYLSGAAHSALFGPDPRLVKEGEPGVPHQGLPAATIGPNGQANDSSAESCGTTGCTQSETSIAVDPTNPNNLVAGWNDGVGFFDPAVFDISGISYSTDGGQTWNDMGTPPNPSATIRISGDPALAICGDGSVHYANLYVGTVGTFSGLSVNSGGFTGAGGALVLNDPVVAVSSLVDFLDKEYMVCDPVTNILYMSYTRFTAVGNGQIEFIRSTDGGASWSDPTILQAAEPIVNQGSYPSFGPNGLVCVAWERDWFGTDPHIAARCSVDGGLSFIAPTLTPRVQVGNVGASSALNPPNGYNRPSINDFPSIFIDNSSSSCQGNIYVAWHGTCVSSEEPFSGITVPESEPNDTSGTADSMAIGDNFSGDLSPVGEGDFVSFSGTAGQIIQAAVLLGTLPDSTLTLYDTDGTSVLAFDDDGGPGLASLLQFTLPSTGTFFVEVRSFADFFGGTYTLELRTTGVCDPGASPAREITRRDILFARSTDGGVTFSPAVRVNDDPAGADQWWPWVSVNDDGQPGMIWYDRRNDPVGNDLTDVFFAQSDDCGASFDPNVRVTDTATSWTSTGSDGVTPNFGDYINLASNGNNFHALWADGRLGDPDVFHATIIPDPRPVDMFGVFRPGLGQWFLDDGNGMWDGCGVETCLGPFGGPADLPIFGDWAGLGTDEIGTFRPSTGQWFLDNGNGLWDGCGIDDCLGPLGGPGDLPIFGDRAGTGADEIGVFRPSTGQWFLDNGNGVWDGCGVETCLGPFGGPGDVPITGDWAGLGTDEIGAFRPSTGQWFLDDGNGMWDGCGIEDCLGPFGGPGDLPVAGLR